MNNKKITSKMLKIISIFAVVFVTYNLVLFIVCGFIGHGVAFWTSYIFMIIAFADVAVVAYLLKGRSVLPKDWLLGYPILRHVTIYIILELILSILFMIGDLFGWKGSVAFASQMVMLAVHLVFVISSFGAKEMVEDVQEKVKSKTTNMQLLQVNVEMVADKATDAEVKNAFKKLAEQIKYSDPMSNEYLSDIENKMLSYITDASISVEVDNKDESLEYCKRATMLLIERNKKCKVLK